jgi:hypothetical protein
LSTVWRQLCAHPKLVSWLIINELVFFIIFQGAFWLSPNFVSP